MLYFETDLIFACLVGPDELHKAKANQKKKSTKDEDVNDEDIEKFVKDMFTQKSGDYSDDVKEETFIIQEERQAPIQGCTIKMEN